MENALNPDDIQARLATESFGRDLVVLPTTHSTNDVARRLAEEGAPAGTLVLAEAQTGGRGRLGRTWLAPPGTSLLMSLILRPALPPTSSFAVTILTATSVAAAVEHTTGLPCQVKWPNDVLIGGRKACGILSELGFHRGTLRHVVVGVGLNVNADLSGFPEIAHTATSLATELGRPVDRVEVLCRFLFEAESRYRALTADEGRRAVYDEWRARLETLGRRVTVHGGDTVEEGLAEGVAPTGELLLRRDDGVLLRIAAGDVSLRPR